jgi:hypothetical protein
MVKLMKMRLRSILIMFLLILFLIAFIIYPNKIIAGIFLVSIAYTLVYGMWAFLKIKRLKKTIIEEHQNKLIQRYAYGKIRAEIDMERDYRISTHFIGYLEAIYRVKQDKQVLEFSTKTKNAEHLVKDAFKLKGEYPPVAHWNVGF